MWKYARLVLICIAINVLVVSLYGCKNQESMEERAYVEKLHITWQMDEFKTQDALTFHCELAYVSKEVEFQNQERENSDSKMRYEYRANAKDIIEFDEGFSNLTNCELDYSHLQGIYLSKELYKTELGNQILDSVWSETQAVLTTPIYKENVLPGNQEEVTLGQMLRLYMDNNKEK